MFDRIVIRQTISDAVCEHLALLHHLHAWQCGEMVEYRSSRYSKLTGVDVTIQRGVATLKCSLHKYWTMSNFGRLRNDTLFTMAEAMSAIEMLMLENWLDKHTARITQFEIGLSMPVAHDPASYIERAVWTSKKVFFMDANYQTERQRTTDKSKNVRKYFKIYDKGWEMRDRRRESTADCILRVETVYRRHSDTVSDFFTQANLHKLGVSFYLDWHTLVFYRNVRADKGRRGSEYLRALAIINKGADKVLEEAEAEQRKGLISDKQYRTIREFVRDWDAHSEYYRAIISEQETDYRMIFRKLFNEAKIKMPIRS